MEDRNNLRFLGLIPGSASNFSALLLPPNIITSGSSSSTQSRRTSTSCDAVYHADARTTNIEELSMGEVYRWTQKQLKHAQHKDLPFRRRLRAAERYKNGKVLEQYISTLNPVARRFLHSQVQGPCNSQQGFSTGQKAAALRLYRAGPSCYKYLAKLFSLPSPQALRTELARIRLLPGIDDVLFRNLKRKALAMDPEDTYCTVMYHQMCLTPRVSFNQQLGYIEGFEDYGGGWRLMKLADHALVFMIRGLKTGYRQPVFYSFSRGKAQPYDIKVNLLKIIGKLQDCGLRPVVIVSDHLSDNARILRNIMADHAAPDLPEGSFYFQINGQLVFPLFDPPHLLKSFRNRFMDADVEYTEDNERRKASWDNIMTIFDLDMGTDLFYSAINIPGSFEVPNEYKRLKKKGDVNITAKLISNKMASLLHFVSGVCPSADVAFTKDPAGTVRLLKFFDELFDSLNGSLVKAEKNKKYRSAVTNKSPHVALWNRGIEVLKTFQFVHRTTGVALPSNAVAECWAFTLRSVYNLWKHLDQFTHLKTRHLNLDALENFFGCIRSRGRGGVANPSCAEFAESYKTLMVGGMFYPRAHATRCENIHSPALLTNVADFAHVRGTSRPATRSHDGCVVYISRARLRNVRNASASLVRRAETYVAACLFRKLAEHFARCPSCEACCAGFPHPHDNPDRRKFHCKCPSMAFVDNVLDIKYVTECVLRKISCSAELMKLVYSTVLHFVNFSWIRCERHKRLLRTFIVNSATAHYIQEWCQDVNNKVSGKDRGPYKGSDQIKKTALMQFEGYSRRTKKILLSS